MSLTFCILGTSSGLPVADKATSGYILKDTDSYTLIDCGGGIVQSYLKRGFDPLKVNRIFISHTHSDHVCELPLFLQLVYLRKRTEKIELYLPEEFIKPFRTYLKSLYIFEERIPFELQFHAIENQKKYRIDSVELTPVLNGPS